MNPKKLLAIVLVISGLVSLVFGVKLAVFDRQPKVTTSLRIDSFPKTRVYLNDREVGETPLLLENLAPGEERLRLGTWETKIKLTAGTLTYVSRNFGPSEEFSGGQTLMLERLPLDSSKELAVVSDPDSATVSVDGQDQGKTSLVLKDLSVGDHEVAVSLFGFSDQVVHAKMTPGYRLNLVAKLAKLVQPATGNQQPATGSGQPYVVIKETETGFLRVRSDHSLSANETARIKPGEKYPLLQEFSGWVKIQISSASGWVSDVYVEKVK